MPDKRRKGETEYSTHRPTQLVRQRLQRMPPEQRVQHQARTSEYQAIWQACHRMSAHSDYKRATVGIRKTMLLNSARELLKLRREKGKTMCGTNLDDMVAKHLRKESRVRAARRHRGSNEVPKGPQQGDREFKGDDGDKELGLLPIFKGATQEADPPDGHRRSTQRSGKAIPTIQGDCANLYTPRVLDDGLAAGSFPGQNMLIGSLVATMERLENKVGALHYKIDQLNNRFEFLGQPADYNQQLVDPYLEHHAECFNLADGVDQSSSPDQI